MADNSPGADKNRELESWPGGGGAAGAAGWKSLRALLKHFFNEPMLAPSVPFYSSLFYMTYSQFLPFTSLAGLTVPPLSLSPFLGWTLFLLGFF